MITLDNITWDTFWDVIALSPEATQRQFVQPISVFMARSYVNQREDYPDISLAIYHGESLIGFTKNVMSPTRSHRTP